MKLNSPGWYALCILFFLACSAFGQQKTGSVKGIVIDSKTKKPIEYASYATKNVKDSTVSDMGVTNKDGLLSMKGLAFGQYKLYAAYIGYRPLIRAFELTPEKPTVDFGDIILEETGITIEDVVIRADLLPMLIKKDTIEFTADAFKTQSDATAEDLLKVTPGMDVDKDGNVTYNGKKIDRVLVDGREFFGSDIKTATQNLPRDIINKVQVIEKKTDDAIFKGVDDGKRENIVNFVLKEDKKKGYFGNATLGHGASDIYESAININRFSGKQQLSVVAQSNNVNRSAFDYSGGFEAPMVTSIISFSGGGSFVGFNGGGGSGINTNSSVSANYNNEWGKLPKKTNKLYLNYNFNRTEGLGETISSRLNLLGVESYYNDRQNKSNTLSNRHGLNGRIELYLDTNTKIMFRPNIGFSKNYSDGSSIFSSYKQLTQAAINNGSTNTTNDTQTPSFGGNLIINRKLGKPGRSLSLTANGNTSDPTQDGLNSSVLVVNGSTPVTTILNQLIDQTGSTNSLAINLDYAEPLSKKVNLGIGYGYSRRGDIVRRSVYDYNTGTTRYDLINNDLSRNLENHNTGNAANVNLNFNFNENLNLSIESEQQYVVLDGMNLKTNTHTSKGYFLIEPNFYLNYKISEMSRFSISGSRSASTPSVSQIQPITDNSNPLNIVTGNPLLRPSAYNNLSISYNIFNPSKGSSLYLSVGLSNSENNILNNTTYDPLTGTQTTFYDNLGGNYGINARLNTSFKIKKLGVTISPTFSVDRGKSYSFFNGEVVNSRFLNFNYGANFQYAITSVLQLNNRINLSERNMTYSYNNLPDNKFSNIANNLSLTTTLPQEFRFTLTSNVYYNSNLALGNANTTQHLANASMEKMFLKKALSFKASVYDIFNNSKNVNRSVSDTYITESVSLAMRRYFLLSATYRLKKFGT